MQDALCSVEQNVAHDSDQMKELAEIEMQLMVLCLRARELHTLNCKSDRSANYTDIAAFISLIKEYGLSVDVLLDKIQKEITKDRFLKQ